MADRKFEIDSWLSWYLLKTVIICSLKNHFLPFTSSNCPSGYNPKWDGENKQNCSRAYCHQRFHHKPKLFRSWRPDRSVRSSDGRISFNGHLGPCVFIDLVLKLILLSAPILRDEASVNRREWSNITRAIKYNRKNIGIDSRISTSAALVAF